MNRIDWDELVRLLTDPVDSLPSVSEIAVRSRDPFRILISTMISARTKDEVTMRASERLFEIADTADTLAMLSEDEIRHRIFPAGFYKTKARNLKQTARILRDDFYGQVPASFEDLLRLPGVGRKTAGLVLGLGFGIPAICVDTHVHRILNRLDAVHTAAPEETERAAMEIVPRKYWIRINEILVRFGQKTCTPVSPRCSICPIASICPQRGVKTSR
jgi:endonuclease III